MGRSQVTYKYLRNLLLLSSAVAACASGAPALAQEAIVSSEAATGPQGATPATDRTDRVVVIGSQIAGADTTGAVPVSVYGGDDIDALGAVNGTDLIRSLPEMGDITWHSTWLAGGANQNAARGDVGSVNLRNLGASNTLLLINGRRSVIHSTFQTSDGGVSNVAYNSNAIPMFGLERLEILRDGAAALYGSDAIAGVMNIVTQSDLVGGGLQFQYGTAQGTNVTDMEASGYFGTDFADGRGNISVLFSAADRTALRASDNWYTATNDKRGFFPGTPLAGLASLDTRSVATPWGGYFQARPNVAPGTGIVGGPGVAVSQGGVRITGATGIFHIQPTSFPGSLGNLGGGISTDDGQFAGNEANGDRDLRYELEPGVEINPATARNNAFVTARYDISDKLEAYGELGYYRATSSMAVGSAGTSTTQPTYIPATAYWNPFGAMYLPDGSLNPNRLPGLTGVPVGGLPIEIRNYRFADGLRQTRVNNDQGRVVAGLRADDYFTFNWDSALVYSWATSDDKGEYFSPTLFIQAVSRTTPDAYNPFNGGSFSDYTLGDDTPGDTKAFTFWGGRKTKTSLALWDLKANKPDLVNLWAGPVGAAFGIEVRRETYKDDRDASIDGTNTYTDWYTGTQYPSDMWGTSPTPDSEGSRTVASAFAEFAVPLVSPSFNIPLVRSVDLQIAGRVEDYSDVGSVAKPKFALAWSLFDGLTARGSWSEGFKAPNLEVVNSPGLVRFNGRPDWIRCEAQVRSTSPLYANVRRYADCSNYSFSTQSYRSGNPDLKPEESESTSYGVVFEPTFLPPALGDFTFTADFWKIEQNGVIGILGEGNGLIIDAYQRIVNNRPYDAVVRLAPTLDDIEMFAGTGLDPVGQVLGVNDQYQNLSPVTAEGLDLSARWSLRGTDFGNFSISVNSTQLRSYTQDLPALLAEALQAQRDGLLDPAIIIGTGGAEQVGRNGAKPEWKTTGTFVWSSGGLTARASAVFTDSVQSGVWPDGSDFIVEGTTLYNASVRYAFSDTSSLNGLSLEFGARNIFDKDPPLNASGNYLATLYQPQGRYLYMNVGKTF